MYVNRLTYGISVVMYNFKELEPLAESDIKYPKSEPYKLCTFSRVMKEKGIEDAINAVESVNAHFGRTVYTLDIFGQVDVEYKERFSQLEKSFPDYMSYGGAIEANKSVETLKSYFALLFLDSHAKAADTVDIAQTGQARFFLYPLQLRLGGGDVVKAVIVRSAKGQIGRAHV